jgi:RNA polymerase sigma-70 factor (ECF subfamily)
MSEVEREWDWHSARRVCLREAMRHTRSRHEAEDAAQNAVLRAWRHRRTLRADASVTEWLRRIARNETMRLNARVLPAAADPEDLVELSAADERTDATILRIDVVRALAALKESDRELLLLRYAADLTQPAVAQAVSIPEGTVKVRLHRLRVRLARELTDHRRE